MSVSINIPKLGVEMTSARLVEWVAPEGGQVREGQVIANLETDKLTKELEAPAAGYVHHTGELGTEYPVTASIGVVASTKEEYERLLNGAVSGTAAPPAVQPEHSAPAAPECPAAPPAAEKIRATPLARRIAKEQGLSLAAVTAGGPGGVIRKRDVLAALEQREQAAAAPATSASIAAVPETSAPERGYGELPGKQIDRVVPLTGMERSIARNMDASMHNTAQMTGQSVIEVSNLMRFRSEMNTLLAESGVKLSYTDIFVKALAMTLRKVPILNAVLVGEEIVYWKNINIGVAVSLGEDGLVVPVVHDADRLSLREIHERIAEISSRARAKALSYEDIEGGTFTLTNYGTFTSANLGYVTSPGGTPILTPGETGIVGTGAIIQAPVVKDGSLQVGNVMSISTTVDHRIINGSTTGDFGRYFIEYLQDPRLMLV